MLTTTEEPKEQTRPARAWNVLDRSSQVCARISLIVGVAVGIWGLYDSLEKQQVAARAGKLQTLTYIQQFIKEDFAIQGKITGFDFARLPVLETKALNTSGHSLYFSTELGDLPEIGEHYERIGAEVKLGYLDFELIFEVVPFPDEFWTRTAPLKNNLRKNWNGPTGRPLSDLWANFDELHDRYQVARHQAENEQMWNGRPLWRRLLPRR
jgi:hypothetical protein